MGVGASDHLLVPVFLLQGLVLLMHLFKGACSVRFHSWIQAMFRYNVQQSNHFVLFLLIFLLRIPDPTCYGTHVGVLETSSSMLPSSQAPRRPGYNLEGQGFRSGFNPVN
jgi:hypothetical protein